MKGRDTLAEIFQKMTRYCAERERCHSEIRTKLLKQNVYGDDLEDIISRLIQHDFLNEERFARSYVSGKFRINKWGRIKIRFGLKGKQVSDYCIRKGMEVIDEEEYLQTLKDLIDRQLKPDASFPEKQKVVAAMQRKGFETELILSILN